MLKFNTQRSLAIAFLGFSVTAVPSLTFADHSWGGYHWARTSNPFTLKLGDNVSSTWDSYLNTIITDWSLSNVLDLTKVTGSTTGRRCGASAGRVEVCNTTYGNNGWLGLAQTWVSGSHITQGTAKMNDTYFNTATYNTPAWRNLVMCQEVAHTFGLGHQDEVFGNLNLDTCMDYTNSPDSNQHPNAHDYEQLVTIYDEHPDAITTVGQTILAGKMPPAMRDIDFSGKPQWGKKIHSSKDGRNEVYKLDFGGGHKVYTFVIWATEEEVVPDREEDRQ